MSRKFPHEVQPAVPDDRPLLSLRDLRIQVSGPMGSATPVHSISLEIAPGNVFALVGPSGSGKSLIGLSVLGLLPENAKVCHGTISLQGSPLPVEDSTAMRAYRGRPIGFCSASLLSLSSVHTVRWHLEMAWRAGGKGLSPSRFVRSPPRRYFREVLQRVQLPRTEETLRAFPHQLSSGTRQRLKLALTWAAQPQLLVVDDPLRDLDAGSTAQLLGAVRNYARTNNAGVLLMAHDVGLVAELADQMAVLHEGTIVERGRPREVFAHPNHAYTKRWLQPLSVENHPPEAPPVGARRPIVRAIQVSKFYRVARSLWGPPSLSRALRGVSFAVYAGQFVAIVGESGSGKSTLTQLLLKLTEPSLGRVLGDEQNVGPEGNLQDFRRSVQFVLQGALETLNPRLTVLAAVAEPLLVHHETRTPHKARQRVLEVLGDVGFPTKRLLSRVSELSCGQAQQVALARALCLRPRLLVLDEPLSALAPPQRQHIANTLRKGVRDKHLAAILLSQDLPLALQLSSRIVVLHAGTIVESAPSNGLAEHALHPYTRTLFASQASLKPGRPRLRQVLDAAAPDPLQPIVGCGYVSRCPQATEVCKRERPPLIAQPLRADHEVACWNPQSRSIP